MEEGNTTKALCKVVGVTTRGHRKFMISAWKVKVGVRDEAIVYDGDGGGSN